jgi:hypothetical protein
VCSHFEVSDIEKYFPMFLEQETGRLIPFDLHNPQPDIGSRTRGSGLPVMLHFRLPNQD